MISARHHHDHIHQDHHTGQNAVHLCLLLTVIPADVKGQRKHRPDEAPVTPVAHNQQNDNCRNLPRIPLHIVPYQKDQERQKQRQDHVEIEFQQCSVMRQCVRNLGYQAENQQPKAILFSGRGMPKALSQKEAHDRCGKPPDHPQQHTGQCRDRHKEHTDMIQQHSDYCDIFQSISVHPSSSDPYTNRKPAQGS